MLLSPLPIIILFNALAVFAIAKPPSSSVNPWVLQSHRVQPLASTRPPKCLACVTPVNAARITHPLILPAGSLKAPDRSSSRAAWLPRSELAGTSQLPAHVLSGAQEKARMQALHWCERYTVGQRPPGYIGCLVNCAGPCTGWGCSLERGSGACALHGLHWVPGLQVHHRGRFKAQCGLCHWPAAVASESLARQAALGGCACLHSLAALNVR